MTTPACTEKSERTINENWPVFVAEIRARLEVGRREYGDASFLRTPGELLGEIEQELLDVAGWAFILWTRIRALRDAARIYESKEKS